MPYPCCAADPPFARFCVRSQSSVAAKAKSGHRRPPPRPRSSLRPRWRPARHPHPRPIRRCQRLRACRHRLRLPARPETPQLEALSVREAGGAPAYRLRPRVQMSLTSGAVHINVTDALNANGIIEPVNSVPQSAPDHTSSSRFRGLRGLWSGRATPTPRRCVRYSCAW